MTYEDIRYEVTDSVAVVTIARPQVMNAFRAQTQQEFVDALAVAEADPGVRCLVVTGDGRGFSAGPT
jgi:2-(1,2-epoxy-1,2-dihydrophenyl)acetyl-CoA isomerase